MPLLGVGLAAINSASSLEQAQGKVDAVFGDSSKTVQDWSKTTTDAYGISQTQALQSIGTLGNFFTSAQIGTEQSAKYSMGLIELSGDMAAFNDVSAARATEAIISGMAGEYDSLQRLGINIKASTVEQEAMNIATADGRTEITEADLALARYNVIMRESQNQHGQAAREYDNFSSKVARMRARLADLSAAWGAKLMPVALDFLGVLEKLLSWVEDLSPAMQRWAIIIAAVAAAAGPLLIALGLMLPGLSLLLGLVAALLSPLGLLVAAAALLAWAFRDELGAALDWVGGKVSEFTDVFKEMRSAGLDPAQAALIALAAVFPQLGSVIAPLRQMVERLGDAFQALKDGDYGAMFDALGGAARNVGAAIKAAIDLIDWGGIASALWDGIQSAAAWAGSQILKIPELVAEVGAWVIDQVQSLAGKIAELWPGWLASAKAVALDIGELAAKVGGWLVTQVVSLAGKIAELWPSWVASAKAVALDIGELMAKVSAWSVTQAVSVAGKIAELWPGWAASARAVALDVGTLIAIIAGWSFSLTTSVASALAERWPEWAAGAKAVVLELADVALSILSFSPTYDGTAVDILIEDMIGNVLVTLSGVALTVVSFDLPQVNLNSMARAAIIAVVGVTLISAIPISVPILLTLGAITLGLLFAFAVWQWAADWARRNPVEAVDMLMNIVLAWDKAKSKLGFSKGDVVEWAINQLLGATGAPIQLDIPAVIRVIKGDNKAEASATGPATDVNTNPIPGGLSPMGGAGGGYDIMEFGGGSAIRGLAELKQSLAAALDEVKTGTIIPKTAEWVGAMAAGLAPIGPTASVSFAAVTTSAATQLGMASASVAANTGQMNATSTANLGAMAANGAGQIASMAASVTAGLSGMRGSAVSTVSSMGSSVGSSITSMSTTSAAQVLGMRMGIVASMATMQSSAVSNANSTRSGVVSAFTSMALQSASAVRSGLGAIPGIVSSVGGSAAAAAYGVGANISSSMAAGMYSALGAIQAAANAMVAAASTALRARAMIASPSKLFRQLGGYVGEGFAQGIEGTSDRVARATADLVSIPDVRGVMASVGASGGDAAAGSGEVKQYFFALTSEEFRALLAKAERGSAFAEGFADELGMRGGHG